MKKLLNTTKELFDSYLGEGKYIIPSYQRGYKWEEKDIERLLNDINNFNIDENLDLFYCLQNITLVEKNDCNSFNVVDGQQRLTTIVIILSYLEEWSLIKDKLQYDIRKNTSDFLEEYIYQKSDISGIKKWEDLLEKAKTNQKDYDYQDIFYIFNAYKKIQLWFETHKDLKPIMKEKILNHVKMIINLQKKIKEQELFENLNGKRVPLDGADLIRALIITRVARREIGYLHDTTKQSVLINEERVKIGLLLDSYNHWWSAVNKQEYFRHFTKEVIVSKFSSINFNDQTHPINNIYKLYALVYNNGDLSMDFFEIESVKEDFLKKLQTLQRSIENWYNDKELYHLILYTSIYASAENKEKNFCKLNFCNLYDTWKNKEPKRKSFIKHLKNRIKNSEVFKEILYTDPQKNKEIAFKEMYHNDRIVNISVLLDIISILSTQGEMKLPARYFKKHNEDIEHIFPQTPIGNKVKDKAKQTTILKQYIASINNLIENKNEQINLEEEINWDDPVWREKMKSKINDKVNKYIPLHSIGNLCVLDLSVNRGFGNDFFLEKRIDIMQKSHKGYYIRPHVYEAFNKIHLERQSSSININQMNMWGINDIISRREYIINQISNFLDNKYE